MYTTKDFKGYVVTGYLTNGKRFKTMCYMGGYPAYAQAFGINLCKGRVWGILQNGKRKLLKCVGC